MMVSQLAAVAAHQHQLRPAGIACQQAVGDTPHAAQASMPALAQCRRPRSKKTQCTAGRAIARRAWSIGQPPGRHQAAAEVLVWSSGPVSWQASWRSTQPSVGAQQTPDCSDLRPGRRSSSQSGNAGLSCRQQPSAYGRPFFGQQFQACFASSKKPAGVGVRLVLPPEPAQIARLPWGNASPG